MAPALQGWGWLAAIVCAASVYAEAAGDPPAAGTTNAPTDGAVLEIVQTDVDLESLLQRRDPFWPVSYLPASPSGRQPDATALKEAPSNGSWEDFRKKALAQLRISGVIRKGRSCYATLNGEMVRPGDVIAIFVDGHAVKFRVRGIELKRVLIESLDK